MNDSTAGLRGLCVCVSVGMGALSPCVEQVLSDGSLSFIRAALSRRKERSLLSQPLWLPGASPLPLLLEAQLSSLTTACLFFKMDLYICFLFSLYKFPAKF